MYYIVCLLMYSKISVIINIYNFKYFNILLLTYYTHSVCIVFVLFLCCTSVLLFCFVLYCFVLLRIVSYPAVARKVFSIYETYIHACVCVGVHTCICRYVRTNTYIHRWTYVRTYIHTSIHTSIHPYIHTYIHTYIYTYIQKREKSWRQPP